MDSDRLLALVGGLYEAALTPELWQRAVNDIADALGAHTSHVMALDRRSGAEPVNVLARQDPAAIRAYMDDFFEIDIRVPRMDATPPGLMVLDCDVWSPEEKRASPVYQDFQRPQKMFHITGAQLGVENYMTWYGVSRELDDPFDAGEVAMIERIVPHVRQAVRLTCTVEELRARDRLLGGLWADAGRGVLVLAPTGVVTFCNAAAEMLARAGVIALRRDRLRFREAGLNGLLAANLAALANGAPGPAAIGAGLSMTEDGEQFGVRFVAIPAPVAPDLSRGAALAVLLVPLSREVAPSETEIAQFGSLFGLTRSEQRVLGAVAAGEDLTAHALARKVSPDTVRKQMKTALAKAGCRSQKDLLRLLERFCFLSLR
ncbi:DNA-binding CsgD family transcriptional regulator [Amorphus suaedae]